jgi:hypothetical protein
LRVLDVVRAVKGNSTRRDGRFRLSNYRVRRINVLRRMKRCAGDGDDAQSHAGDADAEGQLKKLLGAKNLLPRHILDLTT